MECSSACMMCLLNKQYARVENETNETLKKEFMKQVMERLGAISPSDTAPYLSYYFENLYKDMFNASYSYASINEEFNQLVLDMEEDLKRLINASKDPLKKSLQYAQLGNYIDFGAMEHVSKDTFLSLFEKEQTNFNERTYQAFLKDLESAKTFLLVADNCGEIVLDRFFLEELSKQFPHLLIRVMVKGGPISNDATLLDAKQAKIESIASICTTENAIAGCDVKYIGPNALNELKAADVILAKGQANFETLYGHDYNLYFAFLCKCQHFANYFQVEPLTPMFLKNKVN